MKKERLVGVCIAAAMLLAASGCKSFLPQDGGQSRAQSSSAEPVSSLAQSSASPSSEDAESSAPPAQSAQESSAAPPASSEEPAAPQTRQEALRQTKAALSTKVPVLLPADVMTGKGEFLTSTTVSQTWYYKAVFYGAKQPAEVNSKNAKKGTPIASVEGTGYKNADVAKENVGYYRKADFTGAENSAVDLGHRIKAVQEYGLGHAELYWNEGRWSITVDSPSDPAYRTKQYPDNKKLAEQIVAYLDKAMLPAPRNVGVIEVGDWSNNMVTTVSWQRDAVVYRVTSSDPMTALKTAVAMNAK